MEDEFLIHKTMDRLEMSCIMLQARYFQAVYFIRFSQQPGSTGSQGFKKKTDSQFLKV